MHLSFYPLLKQKRSAFFNALLILAMFLGFCSSSYSANVKANDNAMLCNVMYCSVM